MADDDLRQAFGRRLQRRRESLPREGEDAVGWTQSEVAAAITEIMWRKHGRRLRSFDQGAVSRYERGMIPRDHAILHAFAELYETTAEYLLSGAEGAQSGPPPYPAWPEFLRRYENYYNTAPQWVQDWLASLRFPEGYEPTVEAYWGMLTVIQAGTRHRTE